MCLSFESFNVEVKPSRNSIGVCFLLELYLEGVSGSSLYVKEIATLKITSKSHVSDFDNAAHGTLYLLDVFIDLLIVDCVNSVFLYHQIQLGTLIDLIYSFFGIFVERR